MGGFCPLGLVFGNRVARDAGVRASLIGPDPFALSGLRRLLEEAGVVVEVDPSMAEGLLWDLGLGTPGELPEGELPVLALAADLEGARSALGAGALGVLERSGPVERIPVALRAVSLGMRVVDAAFEALLEGPRELDPPGEPLTPRETEVLGLLAQGLSNRGIARRLGTSEHTVKFHVNALLAKLEARNRTDAVVRGTRMGLLTL